MVIERDYSYEGQIIHAVITIKKMKRMVMRYDGVKNLIRISAAPRYSMDEIDRFVIKSFPSLYKRVCKIQGEKADESFYLFGVRQEEAVDNKTLKAKLLAYLKERIPYYEKLMKVTPSYRVSVRNMKSRYGSNSSQTHTVAFALSLAHYDYEIIDSVIIHELTHHFHRNHGKRFQTLLRKHCPRYDEYRKKLIHHQYA